MTTTVRSKDPDTPATYEIVILEALVQEALRSYDFVLTNLVRAPRDTGLYYECTKAGRTAWNYPLAWPRAADEVIADGSVEWTARDPSVVTPPTIQSVVWAVPAGLTLDSQDQTDHVARATISGGTDGVDYEVTARITPTAGAVVEKTLIIPVREQ